MVNENRNASTDASVNNQTAMNMTDSKQTQQGTSGEVALKTFNVADVKGVADALRDASTVQVNVADVKEAVDTAVAKAIEVSLFDNVKCKGSQRVLLDKVVDMLRNDAAVKYKTERCRLAMQNGDDKLVDSCKRGIPCFGGAGIFNGNGHRKEHITELTGTTICDVDYVDPEHLEEMMAKVMADSHTLLAYRSIRGMGFHILARYEYQPQVNSLAHALEEYTHVWETVNRYYADLLGIETTDVQCKDVSRMSFMAHDPNTFYNPDAVPFEIEVKPKRKPGRPPKVPTAAEAEKYVENWLRTQGKVYKEGERNDYIHRAACQMNRFGVEESDCIAWAIGNYEDAANGMAREEITSAVKSAYTNVKEHATESLAKAKRGQSRSVSLEGIKNYLVEMGVKTRFNAITNKYEIYAEDLNGGDVYETALDEDEVGEEKYWVELDDRKLNDVLCELEKVCDARIQKQDLKNVIESSFSPAYNPLRDYVESLTYDENDETDYIDQLASRVHVEPEKQEIHNRFFKKWFVAMVACWIFRNVINHEMLVYVGRQGIFKSTFLRRLIPPLPGKYVDEFKVKSYMTNDEYIKLGTKGLIELDEISALSPRELDTLKSIITMEGIDKRSPYAQYSKERKRLATFCASTNHEEILTDPTGNRRFLVFKVDHILSPFDNPIPYEKVYAQARHLARNGFQYWFDDEDNKIVESLNSEFIVISA